MTQSGYASLTGRPVQAISQIASNDKVITYQTARELEAVFPEFSAEEWLRLEAKYRLSLDNSGVDEAVVIKLRMELNRKAPVREMVRRGWLSPTKDVDQIKAEVCKFFGEKSLDKIKPPEYCARSSAELKSVHAAWVRRAVVLAETLKPKKKYSNKQLLAVLPSIKEALSVPERIAEIPHLLASAGVRVVFIEHLPKTRIDGAAFWLGRGKAKGAIVLSLRFGRIDYFAFTLMHELAHILHEHEPSVDTELTAAHQELLDYEVLANKWASEFLLPVDQLRRFLISTGNAPSKIAIERFAKEIGVHAGVVVGQLQHRGIVAYSSHRDLLVDIRDCLFKKRSDLVAAGVAAFDGFGSKDQEDVN